MDDKWNKFWDFMNSKPTSFVAFVVVVSDYWVLNWWKNALPKFIIPLILSVLCVMGEKYGIGIADSADDVKGLATTCITVLGVMLGFMISGSGLVISSGNKLINGLKECPEEGKRKNVLGLKRTLYDQMMAGMSWAMLCQAVSLIVSILIDVWFVDLLGYLAPSLLMFMVSYCVVLSVSSVLDLYITITADRKQGS